MQTAVYLVNRVLYATLDHTTPYKDFYGDDANLRHHRAIGTTTFVHLECTPRSLTVRHGEVALSGCRVQHGQQDISPLQPNQEQIEDNKEGHPHQNAIHATGAESGEF